MKSRPDDELKNILTELVDKHFPKHECQERGQAMVLAAEALRAFAAHTEAAESRGYDKGWEDCEKREPVPLVDAITFRQEQYGWNDSRMAAMLDLSKAHYSEFKHGKRGLPVNSIRKAYAIGVPASVLLADHLTSEQTKWVQGGLDKSSEQIDIEIEVEDV